MHEREGEWSAILRALRFHDSDPASLQSIPEHRWPSLLDLTDRAHLTLALAVRCGALLPSFARARVERNLAGNAQRYSRLIATSREISDALGAAGVEFVFLKGLTHRPYFNDQSEHRPQYDIDLYCPGAGLTVARRAVEKLGFEPLADRRDGPVDHLPTMIRRTGWRWRGNYFDPEQPFSIELHFRFWNPAAECIPVDGLDDFWCRRTTRNIGPSEIPALSLPDTLSFAALHLFRHLLRGDVRPHHAYELAHFLERSARDDAFWSQWQSTIPISFQLLQAIPFRLAMECFHCRPNPAVLSLTRRLPAAVATWFDLFALSPILAMTHPNKDELLLHLALVSDRHARRAIVLRRLLPGRVPRMVLDAHVRSENRWVRAKRRAYQLAFIASRSMHHVRTLLPFAGSAFKWWLVRRQRAADDRIARAGIVQG
ncbi:MAG TPA: nucleotidyltransferase family protein [Bryobacteraceae bacterium]|nr:nucleotidyltransferase family protein [Bryobacteraceae bacterium]